MFNIRFLQLSGLAGLIMLVIFFGSINSVFGQENSQDLVRQIESLTQAQGEINQKIQETQKTLSSISARGKTLKQEVGRLEANLRQVNLGIRSSENQIRKLRLEIKLLEKDIETQELKIATRREIAGSLLRNLQAKDNEGLLLALLKSQSLAESVSETQVFEDLNNDLFREVNQLREFRSKLEGELFKMTGKKRSVEVENKTLKVKKEVAQDQKAEQSNLLSQTKNQEKKYQATLEALEDQQQKMSNEIDKIETRLRLSQDPDALPAKRAGALGWVTAEPYLTQKYGKTAFAARAYKSKFHNGIDLRARPIGQPIYAAEDGRVLATGNNGRVQYGRYILVKHFNNLTTLSAHLSKVVVSEGDTVKRGEIIAYSGNSGYSFAPHLHFVVYSAESVTLKSFPGAGLVPIGSTLNPLDYLPSL